MDWGAIKDFVLESDLKDALQAQFSQEFTVVAALGDDKLNSFAI